MNNIILIICFILIAIVFIKQNINLAKQEKFNEVQPAVEYTAQQIINTIYSAPIDSIRSLSDFIKSLNKQDVSLPGEVVITGDFNKLRYNSIIMWYGENIPEGWKLCDGTQGTPNLLSSKIKVPNGTYDVVYIMRVPIGKFENGVYNFIDR